MRGPGGASTIPVFTKSTNSLTFPGDEASAAVNQVDVRARMVEMKSTVADYETLVDDVRDLRAFALTSDLKSLTAAARLMGESKATASRRITRLETVLGTALLRRSPRVIETTDEGAIYRARVAQILGLLGDANAVAKGARAVPSGIREHVLRGEWSGFEAGWLMDAGSVPLSGEAWTGSGWLM